MQNYIRRFVSAFKEYIVVVCLLIIALTVLSSNDSSEAKNIRRIALGTFSVVNSAVNWTLNIFVNEDEIVEQKRLNAELMLQVNRLREYGLENIQLKEMLGFKEETGQKLMPGRIISKFVSDIQGVYVVNLGSSDSVSVGMPVITERGLAGIIVEVSEDFSLVRNLYNSNLKIAVSDQRSNIDGILKFNGDKLIIENIPTTYDIKLGDRLVTSDFSTIFPPSIPVGIITNTETDISGVLNKLTVQPFVDLESLRNIFIIKVVQSKQVDSLELNLLGR